MYVKKLGVTSARRLPPDSTGRTQRFLLQHEKHGIDQFDVFCDVVHLLAMRDLALRELEGGGLT